MYTPPQKDKDGNIVAPGTIAEYDEKTKAFGPAVPVAADHKTETFGPVAPINKASPANLKPYHSGSGRGTDLYEMPDGTKREVPKGAPPPAWPPEERKSKEEDTKGGQRHEEDKGKERTRALT